MKTSKITLGFIALTVAASLAVTSCRKKEKTEPMEPDNEQTTAADNNLAEGSSNDIVSMGSQLSENSGTLTTYKTSIPASELLFAPSCATVYPVYLNGAVSTATVDFGTVGCLGLDNRTRKGKLYFDFSQSTAGAKWYRNPGFKMIVTSSGYQVDGNQVNIINKTVTNTTPVGAPTGTNLTWSISANISIIKTNSETVSWTCSRTKELVNTSDPLCYNGQGNPINWLKAKVKLNGTSSGTNAKSENFTATATDLERDFTCSPDGKRRPFISGKIVYTPGNRPTRTIDYGTGTCDFNATITINGQTFAITF